MEVVSYTYDSWGVPVNTTGTLAESVGRINPFRYRGYYYDAETGLYYLNSRYYDPSIGRFVNADTTDTMLEHLDDSILATNLYAYCLNNPIIYYDIDGKFAAAAGVLAWGAAAGGANAWNPVGWVILGVVAVGAITWAAVKLYNQYRANQVKKVANTSGELGKIAGKYGNLKCKEAANAMKRYLQKQNKRAAVITITFRGGRGWIWSESRQRNISENGVHVGILYNGRVYCNVHPLGLPERQWINDFWGTGAKTINRVKF